MSAEQYGARLLSEIHEESFDQLLDEIRHSLNPRPRSILGFESLDRLLEDALFPEPQDDNELHKEPEWISSGLDNPYAERDVSNEYDRHLRRDRVSLGLQLSKIRPPIIEFTSSKSASGKTSLLYCLTAQAILPKEYGGKETAVVWLDTDGRFSASRLFQTTTQDLRQKSLKESEADESLPESNNTTINTITHESLKHVHVFKPQSSANLLATLQNLPTYLLEQPSHHFSLYRQLGLLILDSANAFYWQDRFDAETARLEGRTLPQNRSKTLEIITVLRTLQTKFDCCVVFTTSSSTTGRRPNQEFQPERLNPWTSFATLSLAFSRVSVAQFAPGMMLDECLRDQGKRLEAVKRAQFVVDVVGDEDHGRSSGKGKGRRGFGMRITEDGVEF